MTTDRVIMERKTVLPLFFDCFYLTLFKLAGNDDMHETSKEFEIGTDLTTDCGVSCPLASEKKSPYIYNGEMVLPLFLSYS